MTGDPTPTLTLDSKVVDRIASLVCGDDTPHDRTVRELTAFFEAAGWTWIEDYDSGSRFAWVESCIRDRRLDAAAARQFVLRIADPREYLDEPGEAAAVLTELNDILALEGLEVVVRAGHPVLQEATEQDDASPLLAKAPLELTADLAKVVRDEAFGRQLTVRLEEARWCYTQDAPSAAVIMLGSVLEGVLFAVACDRAAPGETVTDHLQSLIDLAGRRKWVTRDVVDYAHVLRNHRNLIHPRKQKEQGYTPDEHSARIAWNVVVAALNCLAELDPAGTASTESPQRPQTRTARTPGAPTGSTAASRPVPRAPSSRPAPRTR